IAWAIVWVTRRQRLSAGWPLGIVAALSAVLAIATATYAQVWADNFTFWSDVAAKVPDSALAQREIGAALLERNQLDDAERALPRSRALPLDPTDQAIAFSDLGLVYRRKGRFADSIEAFGSALRIAPHPALYHNLGMALMSKAEEDQRRGDPAAVLDD